MTTSTILILIAIGMLAGVLSGFVGVGGGVIIVPALIYALGMSQHDAQGTSLFVLLLPVGILAVNNYLKAGNIEIKYGVIIAMTFVIGGYFDSKLALKFSPALIKFIFGVLMAYVAFRFIVTGYNGLTNES